MVMTTGPILGRSCLTNKPAPLIPDQFPATTVTMTAPALTRHTTPPWSATFTCRWTWVTRRDRRSWVSERMLAVKGRFASHWGATEFEKGAGDGVITWHAE